MLSPVWQDPATPRVSPAHSPPENGLDKARGLKKGDAPNSPASVASSSSTPSSKTKDLGHVRPSFCRGGRAPPAPGARWGWGLAERGLRTPVAEPHPVFFFVFFFFIPSPSRMTNPRRPGSSQTLRRRGTTLRPRGPAAPRGCGRCPASRPAWTPWVGTPSPHSAAVPGTASACALP